MATEALKSSTVTNLDATPVIVATSGEGAAAGMRTVEDNTTTTTNNDAGSTYRMARFPVTAKVKHVWLYLGDVDSNAAAAWTADVNVAFSDSTVDGTPTNLQGLIPTSSLNGTTTTVASYTSPNKLFGSAIAASNSGAVKYQEVTYTGTFLPADRLNPLWNYFGFTNNAGNAQSPGGNFDILIYAAHSAATAHAGVLGVEVDFVI